jgi:large subunit ribosomal protein L28
MARRCTVVKDKGVQTGNKVSHSNRKTSKRFLPNLQNVSFLSDALSASISLRVSVHTLRSIDKNGGIDSYLLSTANGKLTEDALALKRRIKKAAEKKATA